jgi:hypothetical protein
VIIFKFLNKIEQVYSKITNIAKMDIDTVYHIRGACSTFITGFHLYRIMNEGLTVYQIFDIMFLLFKRRYAPKKPTSLRARVIGFVVSMIL